MSRSDARLHSFRVADVMTANVVELYCTESMAQAAGVFIQHGISSAPVIDTKDRCIGMLSATDFLRREGTAKRAGERSHPVHASESAESSPGGSKPVARSDEDTVGCYMTSLVQSITADASLLEAAQIMTGRHVHRLPVLDADGCVVGLISTTDVVAALVGFSNQSADARAKVNDNRVNDNR